MSSIQKKRGRPKGQSTCKATLSREEWCSSCISKRGRCGLTSKLIDFSENTIALAQEEDKVRDCPEADTLNTASSEESTVSEAGAHSDSSSVDDKCIESISLKRIRKEISFFEPESFFQRPLPRIPERRVLAETSVQLLDGHSAFLETSSIIYLKQKLQLVTEERNSAVKRYLQL